MEIDPNDALSLDRLLSDLGRRPDPCGINVSLEYLLDVVRLYGLDAVPHGRAHLKVAGRIPGRSILIQRNPLGVDLDGFGAWHHRAFGAVPHPAPPTRTVTHKLELRLPAPQVLANFADKVLGLIQAPVESARLVAIVEKLALPVVRVERSVHVRGGCNHRRIVFNADGLVERIHFWGRWDDATEATVPSPWALDREDQRLLRQSGTALQVLARFAAVARWYAG